MKALLVLAGFLLILVVAGALVIKFFPMVFAPLMGNDRGYEVESRADHDGEQGIEEAPDLLREVGDEAGYL